MHLAGMHSNVHQLIRVYLVSASHPPAGVMEHSNALYYGLEV